jgi:UDP-N-acetylglucosamine--dolichyl-phosphate N-acetylglucosaminephosphotransferase
LHPSKVLFLTPPSRLATFVLHLFSAFGLTELTLHPNTGNILEANNLTILNFFLLRLGPMNEKRLVKVLMCSQVGVPRFIFIIHRHAKTLFKVAGSVLAFIIRYGLARLVYDGDRR